MSETTATPPSARRGKASPTTSETHLSTLPPPSAATWLFSAAPPRMSPPSPAERDR